LIGRIGSSSLPDNLVPGRNVAFLFAAIVAGLVIVALPLPAAIALLTIPVVLLLVVAYPVFGLGLALFLGPLGALEAIVLGPALLDSGQLALLLTIAAWVGAGLARRRLVVPTTAINIPWLLFVAIAAVSLIDAYSVSLGMVELLKWLEIGLIVWLIVDFAGEESWRPSGFPAMVRLVLGMLLLSGMVQAAIGIWQFGLRGTGPEHFIVLERFYRAYGTFEQPNPFGGYMNLTAFPALGLLLGMVMARLGMNRRRTQPEIFTPVRLWFLLAVCAAVVGTLAVILSWSRGAWLGFLAGAVVLALFSTRHIKRGLVIAGLAAFLVAGGLWVGVSTGAGPAQAIVGRLAGFLDEFTLGDVRGVDINDANYSVLERLAHWQAAADMARDDLWTGVGFGNYGVAYADYDLINFPDPLGHAHNYYLNLLAEIGVPGLAAYILFWLVIIGQSIRLARRLAWPERGVVVGLLAAWVALAVHHLVDKLYVNNIYIHLGVMIGLLQLFAWRGFQPAGEQSIGEIAPEPGHLIQECLG